MGDMSDAIRRFNEDVAREIGQMKHDALLKERSNAWIRAITPHKYDYHFTWMGRPIIQLPQDIVAMQELIWAVRPDVIVETGIAHGGSLIFYASMLELLGGEHRRVIGVDIDIRAHNRAEIEAHPMMKRIVLVEGASTAPEIVARVREEVGGQRTLLALDSNHTHEHVLRELELYSPLVAKGSYAVVFDTIIEDMPRESFGDRPWHPGNSPRSAVREFLSHNRRFVVDEEIDAKLLISVAPGGYLRCVADGAPE
jgi:cephalosporin hydroxylase